MAMSASLKAHEPQALSDRSAVFTPCDLWHHSAEMLYIVPISFTGM